MQHKNILVLGGAGYIGSIVVEELIGKGYNAVVYDNLSKGHREAVEGTFVQGDIADFDLLDETMKKFNIDAVMHFCALSLVGESMQKPGDYFRNNVASSLNILEAMRQNNIKKIVFSSSAATYGEPKRVPIQESDSTIPTNPYGETKLMFEKMLKWYKTIYGINFVALRYFNAAGATQLHGEHHEPETHLIPIVLDAALGKRETISVFGTDYPTKDGTCIRDYIHVLDLASAHILALEYAGSDIFNLGIGTGFSVKEIIETAEKITEKKINVKYEGRRQGDPAVLIASNKLAKSKLNWQHKFGLNEIIRSAWLWKQKHPNGY
jgi:UDP-glucose 4-epimerase